MTSASTSALESETFAVDVELDVEDDVHTILLPIIKSKLTLKSSGTFNLLDLYNKYSKVFDENLARNSNYYEAILVKGKNFKDYLRKEAQTQDVTIIRIFDSIQIVMINAEDVKDKFTFPRFSACVAYNYYENVVSKMDNLEEMIRPSLIAACSTLPMDTDDKDDNLKYNKLFCLAVAGVQFIPKMMKSAGKPDDLIGGVLTICLLIDYTQYKRKHPADKVEFKTFLSSPRYKEDRNTFINAVKNYGVNEIFGLMTRKSSFKMLKLFMEQGCTIELKGDSAKKIASATLESIVKSFFPC